MKSVQKLKALGSAVALCAFALMCAHTAVWAQSQGVVTVTATVGSGGGGGDTDDPATVNFNGLGYPGEGVFLLVDGEVEASVEANPDGEFDIELSNVTAGTYSFSLYAQDYEDRESALVSQNIQVQEGSIVTVSDIFIPPTLTTDKLEARQGSLVSIYGQSAPNTTIELTLTGPESMTLQTTAGMDGLYEYSLNTTDLERGLYTLTSFAALGADSSIESKLIDFAVGDENIYRLGVQAPLIGDVNNDGSVNLVDLSIMSFWYGRELDDGMRAIEIERLSGDGVISLVDFSIAAFYWTG